MPKIEWEKFKGKKILIGSPVCQEKDILKEFLQSLRELDTEELIIGYCFVDDNKEEASSELLKEFSIEKDDVTLLDVNVGKDIDKEYVCDDYTHRWNEDLVEKVTRFKNGIINYALEKDYDYIFFIDSDIVLNPLSLKSLLSRDKDILSNIFWTKWSPDGQDLPQVWLKDAYTLYEANMIKPISQQEAGQQINEFLTMLRKPGVYKVGGLGACTLIKRKPLEDGVNFTKIYNLSFWGEDRFFCIRAVAFGYELFVDTHYPAYHIYRSTDLAGVTAFKDGCKNRDYDILGYEMIDLVTEFLKGYYNYSYREEMDYSWLNLVLPEEGDRLKNLRELEEKSILNGKVISKHRVDEWRLSFFSDRTKIALNFKLVVEGIRNSYSFNNAGAYVAVLRETKMGWKIESIKKESPIVLSPTPLLRRVRDENKLTLSMVVKNEEGRYLERVLEQNKDVITNAVIIDDGSTDKTKDIIKDILGS
ncbi:MAG: glycosyltransferase family 2 protein, partial [Clostridium sp.]|uniref:glycosyltransferase n=1 Tax=Clostridium sp. TaxID=1506 RepID=UPI003F2B7346